MKNKLLGQHVLFKVFTACYAVTWLAAYHVEAYEYYTVCRFTKLARRQPAMRAANFKKQAAISHGERVRTFFCNVKRRYLWRCRSPWQTPCI